MFCPNCGTKCDDGAVFCPNCGTALSNETETTAASVDTAVDTAAETTEKAVAAPVEEKVEEAVAAPAEENVSETVAPTEEKVENTASVVTPITPVTPVTPVQPQQFNNGQPVQPQQFNNGQPVQPQQFNNGQPVQPQQFNNGQPRPQQQFNNGQPVQPQFNNGQSAWNGQPNMQQNVQNRAKKPFKIPVAAIVAAVAVVVLIIAAVVFTAVGKNASNYKKTVTAYVESLAKGEYDKALGYVDLPDSEFLTAEAFRAANGDAIVSDITSLNVTDAYATAAAVDAKKVNVSYVLSIGKAENLTLDLKKSDKKVMLFFNKYDIDGSSLVKKDVIVVVPKGMSLKVNDIAVDSKYVLSEDQAKEYYVNTKADVYKIPYLFVGTAKFVVGGDLVEDFEYEQEYTGDDDYDPRNINLYSRSYKYKSSALEGLQKQAETDFNAMLKAALDNKDFNGASVNASQANRSNVENDYESYFRGRLHRSTYYFDTMNVTNFKATTTTKNLSSGTPRVKVSLSYSSAGSYIYESTGNKYVQSDRSTSSSYIYYVYEDGKWVVDDLYIVLNTYSGKLSTEGN